ncbi:sigma-54-dependent transcriptional regulator [Desulfurivibrio sp. D14AmB]|uniref:sigma-54-dependent transcriptional regulator n=1 Tax=Desulfurivibrio sp. D14AmB TaxID=3374370 RepID=UPI00376EA474
MKVLIVDDDQALCRSMQITLGLNRHEARCCFAAGAGIEEARKWGPDLIFLDVNLPDQSGLSALTELLALSGRPTVVIMTGETDNFTAVEAMRGGAFDFLRKPLDLDELHAIVKRVRRLQGRPGSGPGEAALPAAASTQEMIGAHPKVVELHKQIGLLARSRVTVLIQGESGTGKELAARILHEAAASDRPFVAVNCSAVVPTLLESEFFGHEKGAFTGADRTKVGKLEHAERGTVFLDEIGDMPLDLQAKLLRVLQEEEFVRVGGLDTIPLRARMVAATHCDLPALVREGRFREDLFYRLSVSMLRIPPLRERRSDIPLLVEALLAKIAAKLQCAKPRLDDGAMRRLLAHNWPGNVRELENVLTRAVALAVDSVLTAGDLQLLAADGSLAAEESELPLTLAEAEKIHVEKTLLGLRWNISRAARQLDVSPTTLRKKISDYHLANPYD